MKNGIELQSVSHMEQEQASPGEMQHDLNIMGRLRISSFSKSCTCTGLITHTYTYSIYIYI